MPNGNLINVLQLVRRAGRITRGEIAAQLGLGFSMASKLSAGLIERGLLCEAGRSEVTSGRPSDLLALNPQAGYAIGLDISGSHQKAVVVNLVGEVIASLSEEEHIPADRRLILDGLENMMRSALAASGLPSSAILGIGVSLWASVDPLSGVVTSWTETPALSATLKDFAICAALQAAWQSPHIVVDDIVRNLGIAEVQYGHRQGNNEDFLFALADTGIGLAIMLGGAPYVGPYQIAGEIGHIPMSGVTIPCNCGNTGCLETVASTHAILRTIHQRLNESNVRSMLRNIETQANIQDVMAAAENGDKLAYQVITEAGQYFGSGLASAVNLLGPRVIIVGGTLAKSGVYLDAARRNLRLQAMSKVSTGVRIEPSQLDDLAGARGAAARVLNRLFEPNGLNLLALHP